MINYADIPIHGDLRIPKWRLPRLPQQFEEISDFLGDKRDALRQYRGPYNTHVLEYHEEWSFHRDYADPRTDALGHLLLDAPEIAVGLATGAKVEIDAHAKGESSGKSLSKGLMAGLWSWAATKLLKESLRSRRG